MSATVLPLPSDAHLAVQALLPWYLSATLDAQEMHDVEAHLAACPRCQAELAWERRLRGAHQALETPLGDVEAGLARLHRRLAPAAQTVAPAAPSGWPWWRSLSLQPWARWTLGAQFALIVALVGLQLAPQPPSPTYRTLGAPVPAPEANFIVRFRPETRESQLRHTLQAAGARLVDGPTGTDAYLLHVPADRRSAALRVLRADSTVVLAEALDAESRP